MRIRIFLTISLVVFGVASASTIFYGYIISREFSTSLDRQLRALALTIIGPDNTVRFTDLRNVDEMIAREIGRARTDKFVIIRNAKGEVLFKDKTANLFDLEDIPLSESESFHTEWRDDLYMRVLTLRPREVSDRILQVGVVLPRSITPLYISSSGRLKLLLGLLISGLGSGWILTTYSLRPLRRLGHFLATTSQGVDRRTQLPLVPESLYKRVNSSDEYYRLISDLNNLIQKINSNYFMHRQWTTQMAHELKTPLYLLGLRLESLFLKQDKESEERRLVEGDLKKITSTINSFLGWAEVEYSENKRDVFACKVQKIVSEAVASQPQGMRERIVKNFEKDTTVLCHPQHLEQLLDNLLSNAFKYSAPGSPITIQTGDKGISVANYGPGFSPEVLKRIGEPFNKGNSSEKVGHGLGLAWVQSICKINNWEFQISISQEGQTACAVQFDQVISV